MTFRIENYSYANKEIVLSKATINTLNTYTLVTGRNAIGKSRLLTSIISSYLSNIKKYEYFSPDSILIDHSFIMPRKIIAITNTLNDKFPLKDSKSRIYDYFGNKSKGNITYDRYLFIKKLITRDDINNQCICKTFNYLGFVPYLKIYLRKTCKKSTLSPIDLQEIYNKNFDFFEQQDFKLNIESPSDNELLLFYSLRRIYFQKKHIKYKEIQLLFDIFIQKKYLNFNKISISYDYYNHSLRSNLYKEEIKILLEYDILKIIDVELYKNINKVYNLDKITDDKLINFNSLSSGQQALMNIFLSLSSCIEDNSLICIDEPEISLHPEWQTNFIIKLQELFLDYFGCHFIIATHSPQIVSGLTSTNGFVVDLENNITHTADDYSKKSADYQLANIFGYPGYNNEYLIRIAITLLSKITQKINFNENDLENLNILNNSRKDLPENDPVYFLIEQINALV